jgi:cytochrome b561
MSTTNPTQFAFLSRILHWLMAVLLVAMLFIGVSMVAHMGDYHWLLALHRPLGILILILAALRLITRFVTKAPELPSSMSQAERLIVKMSELSLYALFIALPLVGWAMLSAGHFPIVMFGSVNLPPILSPNPGLYYALRQTHTVLAYLLFLAFLAHFGAVLFHTLIVRDGILSRMVPWTVRPAKRS